MVARARTSHARSVHAHIPFSKADCEATFAALIRCDTGIVLTDGKGGFFAGALSPFHFNYAHTRLIEVGFDGLPLGPLLATLKRRAPNAEITFAQERGPRAKALGRLYRMHGLRPASLGWTLGG